MTQYPRAKPDERHPGLDREKQMRVSGTFQLPLALAVSVSTCLACGSSDANPAAQATQVSDAGAKTASCNIKTDFAGDDVCIPAPSPTEGMQFHYGPSD